MVLYISNIAHCDPGGRAEDRRKGRELDRRSWREEDGSDPSLDGITLSWTVGCFLRAIDDEVRRQGYVREGKIRSDSLLTCMSAVRGL